MYGLIENWQTVFQSRGDIFIFPPAVYECFSCSIFSPTLSIVSLLSFSHFNRIKLVSHCAFNLYSPKN